MNEIGAAVSAINDGAVIVYPTETVYGLGADAMSPSAIERVFALKGRERTNPLSVALSSSDDIHRVARPDPESAAFIDHFLPGPITVICQRQPHVPDELTAGGDRVGIRIPAHPLATHVLSHTGPLTATSANRTGEASVRCIADLDPAISSGVGVVLDGGETDGTASTVVDIARNIIHRRGAKIDAVEEWMEAR